MLDVVLTQVALLDPLLVALPLEDQPPEPEDVKAGWTAFAIFFGLAAVVVLLMVSFVRQIRKARSAEAAGVYGTDDQAHRPTDSSPSGGGRSDGGASDGGGSDGGEGGGD